MTIDAVRAHLRVVEIPIEGLAHRPTGRGVRGFAHRARQGVDIVLAVAGRAVPSHDDARGLDARGGFDDKEAVIEPAEGIAWFAWGLGLATLGWLASRRAGPRWRKANHRGRAIPATLGWAVAVAVAGIALVVVRQVDADGLRNSQAGELLGAAIVFLAGVIDDGFGGSVRGLRGHLRALLQGQVTTGGREAGRGGARRRDHRGVDPP